SAATGPTPAISRRERAERNARRPCMITQRLGAEATHPWSSSLLRCKISIRPMTAAGSGTEILRTNTNVSFAPQSGHLPISLDHLVGAGEQLPKRTLSEFAVVPRQSNVRANQFPRSVSRADPNR